MVGRLLVGFLWPNLLFSVSWLVDFQWVRVAQSLVSVWLVVGFVWLNLQFSVSWLVDFQWGSCGSIFSFLCHGWQTFSGFVWLKLQFSVSWLVDFQWVRVAQSLVFCVMVGSKFLVGFVCLNLQFSVLWLVDFQSCGSVFQFVVFAFCVMVGRLLVGSVWSIFSFLFMVGRLLVGFVWLNLQFSVSCQVDFQWGSCGSIFSFLCHGWQTFSGVWLNRVAQSLVFCVMVGRLLVGFVWLNLQFSVSWLVDFQWGFVWLNLQIFSVSWLVDFQWGSCGSIFFVQLNLQFSVSWLVDFQWGSCGSIFSFLCHGWQTFSGVRVAQSLVFCVMVGKFLAQSLVFCVMVGSGVRVAQSLVFCVMVGRLLVGFVWLNLQFSVSWLVWLKLLVGFVWLNLQFSVSWLVDFQWGSCGSIFSFLCHGWQTFSGLRVAQSLVFCVMVGRLQQWGSCGSIFSFLCHGWQTFSGVRVAQSLCFLCHGWQTFGGVRVAQSLVFCVMVGRLLVGFVWLNLQFSVSWWQVVFFQWGFVWLNLQISVSWLVDFQWGSCGSIFSFLCHGRQSLNFSFLCHGRQTFSGVLQCGSIFSFLCHGRQTFSGFRVSQSLVFCVMVGRLLVGFLWPNLLFSVSWLVDFQWGSCGSIFSFLCHGRQTFSGVRVAQSLIFCFMVGRLLVGFVWLNLQLSVSWLVNFQWGSFGSIFRFLCHGRQIFSGLRVSQSLVFCVMVGRLLVGFVWINLLFSVSWLVDFQWASYVSIFSFLCYGWQTFSGVPVAQSFVFCVMVGRLLVGFVWLNLQLSVSCLVNFQWAPCVSIFSFLCYGWQTFSGVRVAQSFVFCVMVGRLLVGFVCLNLQFSVSLMVDFQWVRVAQTLVFCVMVGRLLVGSCGSIFSFLCHGWQTFSGVRVAQSLVFCVMVGRLFVGFVWLNLQFSVSW